LGMVADTGGAGESSTYTPFSCIPRARSRSKFRPSPSLPSHSSKSLLRLLSVLHHYIPNPSRKSYICLTPEKQQFLTWKCPNTGGGEAQKPNPSPASPGIRKNNRCIRIMSYRCTTVDHPFLGSEMIDCQGMRVGIMRCLVRFSIQVLPVSRKWDREVYRSLLTLLNSRRSPADASSIWLSECT
jgi:hypothetical protein